MGGVGSPGERSQRFGEGRLPNRGLVRHDRRGADGGAGATPLEVALYSPCPDARTPRVKALNHERARLVGLLLATRGPLSVIMLGQMYAAVGARLRRIAEAA